MLSIACYSFINGVPPYTISDGMIYIFLIIVVLFISESFETFSIGNLIALKREVKEKNKEVTKLNTENRELRNQILSVVSTSLNNRNQNTAVFGLDASLAQMFRVESATEKESENIEEEILNSKEVTNSRERQSHSDRSKLLRETEAYTLTKLIERLDVKSYTFQKDVKFSEQFIGIDPIMDRNIVFDAYIKRPLDEVFIEVRHNLLNIMMDFKLYYMISKIYHYSKANQTQAKMILAIPKLPQTYHEEYFGSSMMYRNPEKNLERLNEYFLPAIKSGLLEIIEIDITEDEFKVIEKESTM